MPSTGMIAKKIIAILVLMRSAMMTEKISISGVRTAILISI